MSRSLQALTLLAICVAELLAMVQCLSCDLSYWTRLSPMSLVRINQKVLRKMLQDECSELRVVGNGRLAVEEFNTSGPYGMVILDVHMPIMGGKEAADLIRHQDGAVPIIFLTGELASELQGAVQMASPCSLLVKPCAQKQLLEVSQ